MATKLVPWISYFSANPLWVARCARHADARTRVRSAPPPHQVVRAVGSGCRGPAFRKTIRPIPSPMSERQQTGLASNCMTRPYPYRRVGHSFGTSVQKTERRKSNELSDDRALHLRLSREPRRSGFRPGLPWSATIGLHPALFQCRAAQCLLDHIGHAVGSICNDFLFDTVWASRHNGRWAATSGPRDSDTNADFGKSVRPSRGDTGPFDCFPEPVNRG